VPAATALAVLSQPMVAVLFEHGRFHPGDTVQTARAVVMYCLGAPGMAGVNVLTSAFYSFGIPWLAVQASLVAIALNLALNLLFIGPLSGLGLGHAGLALASSAAATLNALQLILYLRRRIGPIEGRRILDTLLRTSAASAAAALLCGGALRTLGAAWHRGFAVEALTVVAGLALMTLTCWGVMRLLRVGEVRELESLARALARRLRGG